MITLKIYFLKGVTVTTASSKVSYVRILMSDTDYGHRFDLKMSWALKLLIHSGFEQQLWSFNDLVCSLIVKRL